MRRIAVAPRDQQSNTRWNEAAFYELTAKDVRTLERASQELQQMSLRAVQHVIEHRLYPQLAVPEAAVPLIERSWEAAQPPLCGRLDLAYDGEHPPKLLEFEADTPHSLIEAAETQREWIQAVFPDGSQLNSIADALIAQWTAMTSCLPGGRIDFCALNDPQDRRMVAYLKDLAERAGLQACCFPIAEIGWNGRTFTGPEDRALDAVYKLYPWEWMVREQFGRHLAAAPTLWIEPPWKMLLSNKGILPVLWKLFPRHPNLLEASFDSPGLMMSWVRKPLLGRGGANIVLHQPGREIETGVGSGTDGFVYQELAPLKQFDGQYPVVEAWVTGRLEDGSLPGIGIRESAGPITDESSPFVPHVLN